MSHSSTQESIKSVLTGLFAGAEANNDKAYRELAELDAFKLARAKIEDRNPEEFYFVLSYPFDEAIDGLLNAALPGNEQAHFIFKNYEFVENHVARVIEQFEGSPCSADKTSSVISRLVRFHIKGDPIIFDSSEQYTFHHPKKVLANHEEIIDFFEAIYRLYYGDSDRFLEALAKIKATNK